MQLVHASASVFGSRLVERGRHACYLAAFLRSQRYERHHHRRWMCYHYGRGLKLELADLIGMTYNPFTKIYRLEPNTDVNYLVATRKAALA